MGDYLLIRTLVARIIGTSRRDRDGGAKDLEILVRTYAEHYNRGRPHRAVGLAPSLAAAGQPTSVDPRDVRRRDLLGGRVHEYHGAAA